MYRHKLQKPLVHISAIYVQLRAGNSVAYGNDDDVSLPLPIPRLQGAGSRHDAMSVCVGRGSAKDAPVSKLSRQIF